MSLDRLVLWRHGETDYNAAGRLQGHLDSALTKTGHEQARRAAPAIARFAPDLAVSSDLSRARTTAAAFAEVSGASVRLDKRLRETHLGEWQGLSGPEVEHGWPGAMSTWRANPRWAPPGGESRVEVAERALEVVAELDHQQQGTVLLCAHGGLITGLTAKLLGLPPDLWPGLGGVGNCNWVELRRRSSSDHRWRLMAYNAGVLAEG
ncbi:histidine phosphatase family protein [Saccharopolyspora phatthalungensis]|uniref:2,3-bisphosphoglycerate-dependent phosphoglycerate mutase/probable phosphoglycerate mutase n=1 Tax=Saccharopolyspora phatthalungensis TaxID=664693 RepID=A0A840PZ21_9PSEU|nr:histidine phosphatase family protein [Saccharopolyspora phatthalungensis]MBB5153017.1 2,3-bisphosphoglycerate-dependent phosphoglycerate mutase/probable phosphoglycerate mutase [Saccharopolyspora phatthalungensis]